MSNKVDEILQGIRDATTSGTLVWRRVDNDMFYSDSLVGPLGEKVRVSLRHELDKDLFAKRMGLLSRSMSDASLMLNKPHYIVLRLIELDSDDNPARLIAQLDTKSLPDFEQDFKQLSKDVQAQVELSPDEAASLLKLFNRGA